MGEEHMGSPATPSPTKPAGAASNIVKTPETPKKDTVNTNPLLGSSLSTQPVTPDTSHPQATKSVIEGNDDASDVNKESNTSQTPAQSAELQSADSASAQDDGAPIKRITRNSKQKQSQDEIKEKLLEIERKIKQKEKEEKVRKQREEAQRLQHSEHEEELKQKAE